jgi:hypothetical protein
MMNLSLKRYFRCPESVGEFALKGPLSPEPGYFRFGSEITCFGRSSAGFRSKDAGSALYDISSQIGVNGGPVMLPFDPDEVLQNLRQERYAEDCHLHKNQNLSRRIYYLFRPILPLGVRRHLQRHHLRGWNKLPFPRWPVDTTVDSLLKRLLALALKSKGVDRIPFIWFWPDGASASAIMTHDVETERGRQRCYEMMDMDDSHEIKASFQIVPEQRYKVEKKFLEDIRQRNFEVNIHDLNHDGKLFGGRAQFDLRVKQINDYGREFEAIGFRSAILYRDQSWFDQLEFQYDMSVPNVAHLDPQRGGCCTLMPYFVGNILELPVTTIQDHSLFNVLGDYSTQLWEQQTEYILRHNGLMSFIIHPDYINSKRAQAAFNSLLGKLGQLRSQKNVWITLPREVNRWWRQRDQMVLVNNGEKWSIKGQGSERARIAFATLKDDQITYSFA